MSAGYIHKTIKPCARCPNESVRVVVTITPGEARGLIQCRACGHKIEATAETLPILVHDLAAMWNAEKRAEAA